MQYVSVTKLGVIAISVGTLGFSGCNNPSSGDHLNAGGITFPTAGGSGGGTTAGAGASGGSSSGSSGGISTPNSTPASTTTPTPTPSSAASGLTITNPTQNPYTSNTSSVTLSGACTNGRTVTLSGSQSASVACAASAYSFNLTSSVDGNFVYSLNEADATFTSPTLSFQWNRSTVGPAAPVVTAPASSPYYSNTGSIAISGTCVTGDKILLSGDDTQNQACTSGNFNFTVNKSIDGVYAFTLVQQDSYSNLSPGVTVTWTRDTVPPLAPIINTPAYNPYTSGDTNLKIAGSCESAATVTLSGAASATTTCTSSTFSFTVTQNVDGTYNYSVLQTDPASNPSTATAFTWKRDTTIPTTPTITSPSGNPYYSHLSSLVLSGSCVTGDTVTLSGNVVSSDVTSPAGTLTQTCASSAYSFTITKTVDGSYSLSVMQAVSPGTTPDSAAATITWVRDTTAPAAPVITNPNVNPFTSAGSLTLSGTCESGDTVNLSGDDTQSVICSTSGAFSFAVAKTVDSTYNFSVKQTDRAGNVSGSVSQTWVRNSAVPATPTIVTPASNPFRSNGSSIVLSGACATGNTVYLSGDVVASDVTSPNGSLGQACASSGYSFTIAKLTDGTYNLSITQTSPSMVSSGAATTQWIRDTLAPVTTITSGPGTTNLSASVSFAFSSNKSGSTLYCSLDGATFAVCSSPVSYATIANGSHTFQVKATDLAGNTGTAASQTWNQAAYNTIALYHFDSSPGMLVDESNFGAGYNNPLMNTGSVSAGSTAVFGQSVSLDGATQYLSAAHSPTQGLIQGKFTVEGRVKIATSMSNGQYMTLVSKMSDTATNQMSWEVGVYKQKNGSYRLYFVASYNGSTVITPVRSSSSINFNTTSFHSFAVTYNGGSVDFFWDGASSGTATATGGTTVFASTDALRLGKSNYNGSTYAPTMLYGILDEVRISQIIRYSGTYAVPTSAFTAD